MAGMGWLQTTTPRRHRAPKAQATSQRQRAQAILSTPAGRLLAVPLGPRLWPWPWHRGKWSNLPAEAWRRVHVASAIAQDCGVRVGRSGIYHIGGIRAEPSDPAEGKPRRRLPGRYFEAAGGTILRATHKQATLEGPRSKGAE